MVKRLRTRLGIAGMVALGVLALAVLLALAAASGLVAEHYRELAAVPHLAPEGRHWLGTDALGRDLAARLVQGARVSLWVGACAAAGTVGLGSLLGALAGLGRGPVDRTLVTAADAISSIPSVVAMFGLGLALGAGASSAILAIVATQWPGVFRTVRTEAQRLSSADFYRAAEAMGAGPLHQIRHHVLPHLSPLLGTLLALHVALAVKVEAVLGYFGMSSRDLPSWGQTLGEGAEHLARGIWWPVAAPSVALAAVVLCTQIIADRLGGART